jgi:hypothetical protein
LSAGRTRTAARLLLAMRVCGEIQGRCHSPTLTAVLLSSSEARLPPILLLMLWRLELRVERTMALIGRFARGAGDVGGDSIAVRPRRRRSSRQGAVLLCNAALLGQRCGEGNVCVYRYVKQSREREY